MEKVRIIYESPDELCHRISAGGDEKEQYAVLRVKAGSTKEALFKVLRHVINAVSPGKGRLRVRIKNEANLSKALDALAKYGYDITRNNPSGDCLYVWTDGSKKAWLSHFTDDNPILELPDDMLTWFINCL